MIKLNDYSQLEEFKKKEHLSIKPEKIQQFSFALYSAKQEHESDTWIIDISLLTNFVGEPELVNIFVYQDHYVEILNESDYTFTFDKHLIIINFKEKLKGYVLIK